MEFVVEAVSTTRKKITISLTAEDVNAALDKAITAYRKDLALPGFRKGKVPASVVERRFSGEIVGEATQNQLNECLNKAVKEAALVPVSGMEMDTPHSFVRGEAYTCSISFDVLPEITFPEYEGTEVNQTKAVVTENEIEDIMTRLRENVSELETVTEDRLPQDGDVVDVDYAGFDEQGEPVDDVKGEHFVLTVGRKQALDDFEALVKSAKVGEEKEGKVVFPEDYAHKPLAGKTVVFRIKITSLKSRKLPEVNDEMAKKLGQESVEKLREAIQEHAMANKVQSARSEAMKTLVDGLLDKVTVDVPESMLESRIHRILGERDMRLQQMGKSLQSLGKKDEELREEAKEEALESLRPQVMLMALAHKEKLSVTQQELEMAIYSMAMRAQQDYKQIREAYEKSGLIHELQDRLLAEKAVELLYSKAHLNEVEPEAEKTDA